jgi:hypothetical protein
LDGTLTIIRKAAQGFIAVSLKVIEEVNALSSDIEDVEDVIGRGFVPVTAIATRMDKVSSVIEEAKIIRDEYLALHRPVQQ